MLMRCYRTKCLVNITEKISISTFLFMPFMILSNELSLSKADVFHSMQFIQTALTSNIRWSMHHHEWVKLWSHIWRRCSKCHFWSLYTVTVTTTTRQHWIMAMLLLLLLVINISCILEVGITFNYWTSWNNTHHKTLQFKMKQHLTHPHTSGQPINRSLPKLTK